MGIELSLINKQRNKWITTESSNPIPQKYEQNNDSYACIIIWLYMDIAISIHIYL